MEVSKIKVSGKLDLIDIKDAVARDALDTLNEAKAVTAAALTDLNEKLQEIADFIEQKELAISAAINQLNNNIPHTSANTYELVDMGLPSGRLWADRNIGAESETDGGLYFLWGDVEGFSKDSGRYCNGTRVGERNWTGDYSTTHGCMLGDSQNIPTDSYFDAARKNMGAPWRMPTSAEYIELFNSSYTTNEWVTNYKGSGMNGRLVTSKANGNKLFFPAAGHFDGGFDEYGSSGYYWPSLYVNEDNAYLLYFDSDDANTEDNSSRHYGCSVRGVQ